LDYTSVVSEECKDQECVFGNASAPAFSIIRRFDSDRWDFWRSGGAEQLRFFIFRCDDFSESDPVIFYFEELIFERSFCPGSCGDPLIDDPMELVFSEKEVEDSC
jgi:hypothetical protein